MCKTKADIIVGLSPHSSFFKFLFYFCLFFLFFFFFPEKVHKLLCVPEPLCRQHWTPAAKQGLLCYWRQQVWCCQKVHRLLHFLLSCGKEHKCWAWKCYRASDGAQSTLFSLIQMLRQSKQGSTPTHKLVGVYVWSSEEILFSLPTM